MSREQDDKTGDDPGPGGHGPAYAAGYAAGYAQANLTTASNRSQSLTQGRVKNQASLEREQAAGPDQPRHRLFEMVFSCPHCGVPFAETLEPSVDIHPGAGYHCDQCKDMVIFEALTPAEYRKYCKCVSRQSPRRPG